MDASTYYAQKVQLIRLARDAGQQLASVLGVLSVLEERHCMTDHDPEDSDYEAMAEGAVCFVDQLDGDLDAVGTLLEMSR